MTGGQRDPYEQFGDVSTTPIWDVVVGLFTVATLLGGGLAAIYAAGYFMTAQANLAWPSVGTVAVLLAVDIALRGARSSARRRVGAR
jgi:energy-converting hydrogenase Eha subunit C